MFYIFIYLSAVPGRGFWRGRGSVAVCGMAWERQSDPGLRWQLCYDFSARSWWMVGWMLPISPSFCVHRSVCLCPVCVTYFFSLSFALTACVVFGWNIPLLCCRMLTCCARCMFPHCASERTALSHLLKCVCVQGVWCLRPREKADSGSVRCLFLAAGLLRLWRSRLKTITYFSVRKLVRSDRV